MKTARQVGVMTADLSGIATPTSRTKRDDEPRKTDNARKSGVKVKADNRFKK
ncbi:MAG: hypothetical protein QM751_04390 [Paludibacteraceae bacterium]